MVILSMQSVSVRQVIECLCACCHGLGAHGHTQSAHLWSASVSLLPNTWYGTLTGDAFLVVTGSSQPKIYDRDGHELGEFVKGDMYIRDLRNTKGHLYRCCAGQWHPDDRQAIATSKRALGLRKHLLA